MHKRLRSGETLFHEGDPGDCAYLIERGRIAIQREQDGRPYTLSELGPGACFGEMALLSQQPRMASAVACEPTVLSVITDAHLHERLQRSDPLVRHLLQLTLQRYRQTLGEEDARLPQLNLALEKIADADEAMALDRVRTENALIQALDRDEFELHFQPIVRLSDRVTAGFEALLRWNRPGHGRVAPDLFIPVAEDSHIIAEIGRWVIRSGAAAHARLAAQYEAPLSQDFSVSVNLAARQFQDGGLSTCIAEALAQNSLEPRRLRLEVTESQLLDSWDDTLRILKAARDLGCRIAIDDFGTGHSSLAYLSRLPVDTLKIDKAFLTDLMVDEASRQIVRGIAALAHSLGMSFIAEGGETAEQIELLGELGVEYVQGYYFGRPFALN